MSADGQRKTRYNTKQAEEAEASCGFHNLLLILYFNFDQMTPYVRDW